MKEFTSLTPVSKIQINPNQGPHSPQPQTVSERPLERPTLVRPQRTSTVLIQNNEANQVRDYSKIIYSHGKSGKYP